LGVETKLGAAKPKIPAKDAGIALKSASWGGTGASVGAGVEGTRGWLSTDIPGLISAAEGVGCRTGSGAACTSDAENNSFASREISAKPGNCAPADPESPVTGTAPMF